MPSDDKKVLFIIAPQDFRDEEYAKPRAALYASGAHITTASREAGYCKGMLGSMVHADEALADVADTPWDMVVFVGGGGAETYFDDDTAHALARKTLADGKPLAAICIAPSILAHAGVLDGVQATAWPDQESDLKAHGALWDDDAVVVGETETGTAVVTANGPAAAFAFGQTLVGVLYAAPDSGQSCCRR